MIFKAKCPYCGGKNLYLKRTWPEEQYGCRDCEKEVAYMKKCGMDEYQIKNLFAKRKKMRGIWR